MWLSKTSPIHVKHYGTFITTDLKDKSALITARTTVVNELRKTTVFDIEETIVDSSGKVIASGVTKQLTLSAGKAGLKGSNSKGINVIVYSNCEQVELFLNNTSQGKQTMPINGHLEWKVNYQPGVLLAGDSKTAKKLLPIKCKLQAKRLVFSFLPIEQP